MYTLFPGTEYICWPKECILIFTSRFLLSFSFRVGIKVTFGLQNAMLIFKTYLERKKKSSLVLEDYIGIMI